MLALGRKNNKNTVIKTSTALVCSVVGTAVVSSALFRLALPRKQCTQSETTSLDAAGGVANHRLCCLNVSPFETAEQAFSN